MAKKVSNAKHPRKYLILAWEDGKLIQLRGYYRYKKNALESAQIITGGMVNTRGLVDKYGQHATYVYNMKTLDCINSFKILRL